MAWSIRSTSAGQLTQSCLALKYDAKTATDLLRGRPRLMLAAPWRTVGGIPAFRLRSCVARPGSGLFITGATLTTSAWAECGC